MTAPPQPLAGLTVLELGQIYNGPYCALLLAYHGAQVIKIEPPSGDLLRRSERSPGGASYPFLMLNANKESVRLNLKDERGRALFLRLADRADVIVENFAAGVMDRLQLGYTALSARNPRIIFASGSGFGSTGPYVGYPAMDFTIQALVGAMAVTGHPDQPPMKCGPTFIDILGATHLFAAILLALREREQSGRGQHVEVAMFDAAVPSLLSYLAPFYELGREITRSGNRHVVGAATPYNIFPCIDGDAAILCVSNQHWLELCTVMERPDLAAETRWHDVSERARDWQEIEAAVEQWTRTRRRDDVARLLATAGIPSAPVRTLSEVAADPHLVERAVIREVEHPQRGTVKVLGTPIKMGTHAEPAVQPAPGLGEHTDSVLERLLGLAPAEIDELRRAGVI